MRIVIAGGHGQIARRLGRLLTARGGVAVGLVRNPAHQEDLLAQGMTAVVCDLEQAGVNEIAPILAGADAVVFAAGAGPGSGADRKHTVDRGAAVLLTDAAARAGVRRYLMVSTRGAGSPPRAGTDEIWAAYIEAKTAADEYLMAQDLDWTVLRPGALTNEPGRGTVRITVEPSVGEISRDDVARVLLALLDTPATAGQVLEVAEGGDPIDEAVTRAATELR